MEHGAMGYEGEDSKHCARVEAAKRAVADAQLKYQRGGSLDAVNKANADLRRNTACTSTAPGWSQMIDKHSPRL